MPFVGKDTSIIFLSFLYSREELFSLGIFMETWTDMEIHILVFVRTGGANFQTSASQDLKTSFFLPVKMWGIELYLALVLCKY